MTRFIKIQLLSEIASKEQEHPQWRDRDNTEKFSSASEARQFMAKQAPRALFVPYSLSNSFRGIQKVRSEAAQKSTMPEEIGTPYRLSIDAPPAAEATA